MLYKTFILRQYLILTLLVFASFVQIPQHYRTITGSRCYNILISRAPYNIDSHKVQIGSLLCSPEIDLLCEPLFLDRENFEHCCQIKVNDDSSNARITYIKLKLAHIYMLIAHEGRVVKPRNYTPLGGVYFLGETTKLNYGQM